MTNGDIKAIRDRFHKKARIKKKIENRKYKALSKIIHKLHQKNREAFVYGYKSRKELEISMKKGEWEV